MTDYELTFEDIEELEDADLVQLLAAADQDKEEIYKANCVYCMCLLEQNFRKNGEYEEAKNVECSCNIRNGEDNSEILFGFGTEYTLYAVENSVLAFGNNKKPYVFSINENDRLFVLNCFRNAKDDFLRYTM